MRKLLQTCFAAAALVLAAGGAHAQSFCNTTPTSIPNSGNANPYPSALNVSGLAGSTMKVTVSLNSLYHTFPDDIDMLLVAPTGQSLVLMSDVGGSLDLVNVNLLLDDAATAALPDNTAIASGSYRPTNYDNFQPDNYPAPAPAGPYTATQLATFNGQNPNGSWQLFIVDDAAGDVGSLGGWCLNFTMPLAITTPTVPAGQVGVSYSQALVAANGTTPYAFNVSAGSLPAGLTMATDGTLSGTPAAGTAGSYAFTALVTDFNGREDTQDYTLVIDPPAALAITPASLPDGTVGSAYSQTLSPVGGTAPFAFALSSGSLPAGLSLAADGALSGTPAAGTAGSYAIEATVTDRWGATGTQAYTLVVTAPDALIIHPAVLPDAQVGAAYSQVLTPLGGTAPFTFALTGGSLPTGLSLAPDGTLAGTPAAGTTGSYPIVIAVTDIWGATGTLSAMLEVTAAAVVAPVPALSPWSLGLLPALLAGLGWRRRRLARQP